MIEEGKLPPQAIDIEEQLLGIVLFYDSIHKVASEITPEMFYDQRHKYIYTAIQEMYGQHMAIDMLTVTQYMKDKGHLDLIGGAYYFTQLSDKVASDVHVEYYAKIIQQQYIGREIIRVSGQAMEKAYDGEDFFQLRDKMVTDLIAITQNKGSNTVSIGDQANTNVEEIYNKRNGEVQALDIQTGLEPLDQYILGFGKQEMIVLAGRPGMGKTAMVTTLLRNVCYNQNIPAAFFSLEMSAKQITTRVQAMTVKIPYNKISSAVDLQDNEFNALLANAENLEKTPMFIDDRAGITPEYMRAKLYEMKYKHNIQLAFIDYIQLMNPTERNKNSTKESVVSGISQTIKETAKELDIPIVVLSQLNRGVESRPDKRPQLSDLRESGAIEQDADKVIMLYRPAYYQIDDFSEDYTEAIVAKHRNGTTGIAKLSFDGRFMTFNEYNEFKDQSSSFPL